MIVYEDRLSSGGKHLNYTLTVSASPMYFFWNTPKKSVNGVPPLKITISQNPLLSHTYAIKGLLTNCQPLGCTVPE